MSQDEANRIAQDAQRQWRSRRMLKFALPTVAALGAGAAVAVATIPSGDGTITGCYLTNTIGGSGLRIGQLRVIDPSLPSLPGAPNPAGSCLSDEATISWNQSGPAGPLGPAGPQGPAGGQGAAGTPLIGDTSFGISGSGKTFLKLEGIKGESTDKVHSGQITVGTFSLGAHGGGGGSGRTTIQSFTITKAIDKSSALLLQAAATGKLMKDAVLTFSRKAGSKEMDYLKFDFQQVFVSSVTDGTSSSNEVPAEQVTFNFQKCKETFISGNGKVGQTVNFSVGTNSKI
jgi:type VI secretion system secreted protein Hcp